MRRIKIALLVLPLLLLAQGCSFNFLGGSSGGGGVLKSRDSGDTWQEANRLGENSSLASASVARVRMDWEDKSVLYLASPTGGVYQSINAGESWNKVLSGVRVYDLQINPKNPAEVLAGGIQGSKAKLFKTEDKGQTWLEVFSEANVNNLVSAIAYDPNKPERVYIGLSTGEIIASRNGGVSWELVNRLAGRILQIHVDPRSSSRLYALSMREGLFRSEDSGVNWKELTARLNSAQYLNFYRHTVTGTLYLGDAGGLHKTVDEGNTWVNLDLPKNQASETVSAFALDPNDPNIFYAVVLQTLYKSNDSGATWQTHGLTTGASVRDILIKLDETNVIYLALGEVLQ